MRWPQVLCTISDLLAPAFREGVAIPPAKLRYRAGESLDSGEFVRLGRRNAQRIAEGFRNAGAPIRPGMRVLDFGCGCGRVLAWMAREQGATSIDGVDVDAEAIAWCHSNLACARFTVTDALPPLPFPEQTFDLIYSVAVLALLDDSMRAAWLRELGRVLKPDGWLLLAANDLESERLRGKAPSSAPMSFHRKEDLIGSWRQVAS